MKKQYVTHFDKNTKHGVICFISPRVDKQKNKIPPQISKLKQKTNLLYKHHKQTTRNNRA